MNAPAPGLRLRSGRYQLLARLREGGTAVVWRGVDLRDRAERAFKAIPLDSDGARAAELEAEAVLRVAHPGVLRVHATFEEAGHGWIVMDLALGSLADAVEAHGPLEAPLARAVACALADTLAAAHAAGVVHRDLKPQNVLVMPDGSVRLADFGIAQVLARGQTRTRTGAMMGTIAFMAPEQRRDPRAVGPATDVYALGMLLAWMRTGRTPGEPYVEEAGEALRQDLLDAGEADDTLLWLLLETGRYDPARRPRDGAALRERLRALPGDVAADLAPLAARLAEEGPDVPGHPRGAVTAGALRGRPEPPPQDSRLSGARGAVRAAGWSLAAVGVLGALWAGTGLRGDAVQGLVGTRAASREEGIPACSDATRFSTAARTLGPRETVGAVAADVDGDSRVDTVFANQLDETLSVYWGAGVAQLRDPQTLPVGRVNQAPAVGDLDGDGRADLLVPDADRSELRAFLQVAPRRFEPGPTVVHPDIDAVGAPSLLFWDEDAVLDLLVTAEGGLRLRRGLGGGRFATEAWALDDRPSSGRVVRRPGRPDAVLSSSAEEIALEEAAPGGVPRRLATWRLGAPATVLPWQGAGAPRFFAQQGERILELLAGGRACVYAPWDARVDVQGFADLDADGLPEAIGVQTCAYCTSNHVLWRGR